MLSLIPQTFGNRALDGLGNAHSRRDHRGLVVFRNPGHYVGRHRAYRPDPFSVLLLALLGSRDV